MERSEQTQEYFEGRVDMDNVVDNDEEKRFKGKHDKAEPQINIPLNSPEQMKNRELFITRCSILDINAKEC